MADHEASEFNTGTEVFAAWLMLGSLVSLILLTYYFTVIRQPPKPILEWLYDALVVPPFLKSKVDSTWTTVKGVGMKQLAKVPGLAKFTTNQTGEEMKPLRTPDDEAPKASSVRQASVDETTEVGACVIGAALDDDDYAAEEIAQANASRRLSTSTPPQVAEPTSTKPLSASTPPQQVQAGAGPSLMDF